MFNALFGIKQTVEQTEEGAVMSITFSNDFISFLQEIY